MKNLHKYSLLTLNLLSLLFISSSNASLDVRSPTQMIRIKEKTIQNIRYRGFSYCKIVGETLYANDSILINGSKISLFCEQIGKKSFYTLRELEKIAASEKSDANLKVVTGIATAVVVGTLTGGGAFLYLAAGAGASVTVLTGNLIIGGAALTGATTPLWFDQLNPVHQYDQAEVLSNAGLQNSLKITHESEETLLELKELLNEIL